jgi:hypothetical protein
MATHVPSSSTARRPQHSCQRGSNSKEMQQSISPCQLLLARLHAAAPPQCCTAALHAMEQYTPSLAAHGSQLKPPLPCTHTRDAALYVQMMMQETGAAVLKTCTPALPCIHSHRHAPSSSCQWCPGNGPQLAPAWLRQPLGRASCLQVPAGAQVPSSGQAASAANDRQGCSHHSTTGLQHLLMSASA